MPCTIRPTLDASQHRHRARPGENDPALVLANARGGNLAAQETATTRAAAWMTGPSGEFVRLFTEYFTEQ